MYCEDVDLSLRALKEEMRCIYVPKAILWHKVSNSFNSLPVLPPSSETVTIADNSSILIISEPFWLFLLKTLILEVYDYH